MEELFIVIASFTQHTSKEDHNNWEAYKII